MIIGAYSLHLYCDGENCRHSKRILGDRAFMEIGDEPTKGRAIRAARRHGWYVGRERCFCPVCLAEKAKK